MVLFKNSNLDSVWEQSLNFIKIVNSQYKFIKLNIETVYEKLIIFEKKKYAGKKVN